MEPLLELKHVGFVFEIREILRKDAAVIFVVALAVQPYAFVIVTV